MRTIIIVLSIVSFVLATKPFISASSQHSNYSFLRKTSLQGTQDSMMSPIKRIKIYYYISGSDAVPISDAYTLSGTIFSNGSDGIPDNVQFVAFACDSVYSYLHDILKYDVLYNQPVVVMEELGNYYSSADVTTNTLLIDNDLSFLNKNDVKNGYCVTLAHEYYHFVQFSFTDIFNFLNEPSAVWMEDRIFPDVNDYLQYLGQR